jgi:hypothetical protein
MRAIARLLDVEPVGVCSRVALKSGDILLIRSCLRLTEDVCLDGGAVEGIGAIAFRV